MDQRRRNRGIYAAGNCCEHAFLPDLFANSLDGILDDGFGSPLRFHSTDIDYKMLDQFFSVRRVMHLRVKLHTEIFALQITHRREGTVAAARQCDKTLREFCDAVAMRHPYRTQLIEHRSGHGGLDSGIAVLAL